MKSFSKIFKTLLVSIIICLIGCTTLPKMPPAPEQAEQRDRLTFEELISQSDSGSSAVHNAYFMPVGDWKPALHDFAGTLNVPETPMQTDIWKHRMSRSAPRYFPGFSVQFFTHKGHLVPVERNIIQPVEGNPRSSWNLILSPGKVWSEPADNGMSRASFPFVLVSVYSYETHNGIATFVYDDTRASNLRMQIVQEISWRKFDFRGHLPMIYTPGPIAGHETAMARFDKEMAYQTPIRPWSELQKIADPELLENFNGVVDSQDISATGMIVDNILYLQPCSTRYGAYPYPSHMRNSVFSVTKSAGSAIGMLRLAQKYGDEVFDLKIKDYLSVTAAHDGWDEVTFGDCLNMVTGIGDNWPQRTPNKIYVDENNERMLKWAKATTARDKLKIGFEFGNYPWGPGEVLRYNSTHTFVLAAAMDSYLKSKEGPHANLWDMVIEEVFNPIGIIHAPLRHTQEPDGSRGIPHFLAGFYPTPDDIAKITMLLQNGGKHRGRQLLSRAKLAQALYKTEKRGFSTNRYNGYGYRWYNMSFWSAPYRTQNGCFFQIPYMAGWLGNLVVLLPNGISAFRFADGNHYDPESLILGAEAIRPICDQGIPASVQNDVGPVCDAPLPEDLVIETPGESVPAEMARFSGIWGNGGVDWFSGMLCTSLAVKSIEESGKASVIVGWGKQELWGFDKPGFTELPAKIEDGKLTFKLQIGWFAKLFHIDSGEVTCWFVGDKLRGAIKHLKEGRYGIMEKIE
jgi:CubicO group peptidase (beta-lactamase class C family)